MVKRDNVDILQGSPEVDHVALVHVTSNVSDDVRDKAPSLVIGRGRVYISMSLPVIDLEPLTFASY